MEKNVPLSFRRVESCYKLRHAISALSGAGEGIMILTARRRARRFCRPNAVNVVECHEFLSNVDRASQQATGKNLRSVVRIRYCPAPRNVKVRSFAFDAGQADGSARSEADP